MAKKISDYDATTTLLATLRARRDRDEYATTFPQELQKPERKAKTISSLAAQTWPMSPQLAARFDFAGAWKNPFPGLDWLALSAMKQARTKKAYRNLIDNRATYWEGSVLQQHPRSHISLWGIDVTEASEVYLVWTDECVEPAIVWYVAQHEHEFKNFISYLQYLVPADKPRGKSTKKAGRR